MVRKYYSRFPGDPTGELLGDRHWPLPDNYYAPYPRFVVVHKKRLTCLGIGEYRTIWANATRLATSAELVIGQLNSVFTERFFEVFTAEELQRLYMNVTGNVEQDEHGNMVDKLLAVFSKAMDLPVADGLLLYDPNKVNSIQNVHPNNGVQGTENSTPVPKVHRTQNTFKTPSNRPNSSTATGRVWDIADTVKEQLSDRDLKLHVVQLCVEAGINASTAQVQFGKWMASRKLLT